MTTPINPTDDRTAAEAFRKLRDAATPGPWNAAVIGGEFSIQSREAYRTGCGAGLIVAPFGVKQDDAMLIIASRTTDLPERLLAAVEEVERLRARLDEGPDDAE